MLKKMSLLLSTGALILAAAPALAAPPPGFVGTLSGAYGWSNCNGCGSSDAWSIGGSGAFGLGMSDFAAQVDASYSSVADIDLFGVGGSVYWAPAMGRAGLTVSWTSADEGGADFDSYSYGLFGDYFISDAVTLAAKGGGVTVNVDTFGGSASETGAYVGGALIGYLIPNLAIQADVTYISVGVSDGTSFGVGAEYLVSNAIPISIFGGYSRSSGEVDTWLIGVRVYAGPAGMTLVEKHRNGTLGWAGSVITP
jgi:hypothetical protein